MSSTQEFISFVEQGYFEVKNNFKIYRNLFFSLIVLANLDEAYKSIGGVDGDGISILFSLLSIFLTFMISAKVILMNKKNLLPNEKLIYILLPFLLYSFYFSMIFLLGLVLLIIPGILVLIYLSQAPLIAALAPVDENFFKRSITLVKKNVKLVAWVTLTSLFLEFATLLFEPIADQKVRWAISGLFSIPDAFFTLVLTVASVKVFYYLNET